MKRQIKLSQRQQAQTEQTLAQTQEQSATEFNSVEEMLRHDATHTPLPPTIADRLRETLGPVTPPPRSWWRRFFGH